MKQLVLSNVKVVDDKDFTSLSVSSEKWIRLHEVKRFELIDYLKQLKQQGYSVVGAEQTADSVPLNRFQFPTKAVLVLGSVSLSINSIPLLIDFNRLLIEF